MIKICPNCTRKYIPILAKRPDFEAKNLQWKLERELIQKVWPYASSIQREQLQSGLCSDKCWDEYVA